MARKPVDVSFETFLRENPEYSFSRMLEKSPRVEESVLPKGSRSSLRAARRVLPDAERSDWVNREVRSAYDAWRSRRSGALGYRGEQSVSDQLGGAERFIREFYGAADAQPPQSDIEYESSGEGVLDWMHDVGGGMMGGSMSDFLSPMEPFGAESAEAKMRAGFQARLQKWKDEESRYFYDAIPMDQSGYQGTQDLEDSIHQALSNNDMIDSALSAGMSSSFIDTFPTTASALESGESQGEAAELRDLLDSAQDDEIYERDLGGGRHEIEIGNADPDKRGRFIYDENGDTLTNLKGR
tara:strand:- start:3023 stop:3913 length:891 start_codon:yes stop_codon:yes gene_type:complete